MAKVRISFDEDRVNLLNEQVSDNKEEIDKLVNSLISFLDGKNIGVAISALLFVITSAVRSHFDKVEEPNRFQAMHQIGMDLIQYIHLILLKKF